MKALTLRLPFSQSALVAAAVFTGAILSPAVELHWTGDADSNFANDQNWNDGFAGTYPGLDPADVAIIDAAGSSIFINNDPTFRTLNLINGSLQLAAGKTATLTPTTWDDDNDTETPEVPHYVTWNDDNDATTPEVPALTGATTASGTYVYNIFIGSTLPVGNVTVNGIADANYSFAYIGNGQVQLTVTGVPKPSTYAQLCGGVFLPQRPTCII